MDAAQLHTCMNYFVQLLKNIAAVSPQDEQKEKY